MAEAESTAFAAPLNLLTPVLAQHIEWDLNLEQLIHDLAVVTLQRGKPLVGEFNIACQAVHHCNGYPQNGVLVHGQCALAAIPVYMKKLCAGEKLDQFRQVIYRGT